MKRHLRKSNEEMPEPIIKGKLIALGIITLSSLMLVFTAYVIVDFLAYKAPLQ